MVSRFQNQSYSGNKQMGRQTEVIALPPSLMRSVISFMISL